MQSDGSMSNMKFSKNPTKPNVVCLCGSSRFVRDHEKAMMEETLKGHIVIPLGLYGHADYPPGAKEVTSDANMTSEVKQMLDRLHKSKIDLANEILVINPDGYVGESTKNEIEYAKSLNKGVRYYF